MRAAGLLQRLGTPELSGMRAVNQDILRPACSGLTQAAGTVPAGCSQPAPLVRRLDRGLLHAKNA